MRALLIIALLVAWFLPLIIAALYKLPHQGSIAVLSLLLGWTGAGWLAALVIVVGGAIRATRPPLASQEQPRAPGPPTPAYSPAPPRAPAQARAPRSRFHLPSASAGFPWMVIVFSVASTFFTRGAGSGA